jgi:hypothetical protein
VVPEIDDFDTGTGRRFYFVERPDAVDKSVNDVDRRFARLGVA